MTKQITRYLEVAYEHPSNRGVVIQKDHIPTIIKKAQQDEVPLYVSYYALDEKAVQHFKIYKTIRNYTDDFYIDKIIFDVDKGVNTDEHVHNLAKAFINKLNNKWKIPESDIHPWYSGNGYHIEIPNVFRIEPSNKAPQILRETCSVHFPEVDNIFDHARIIRVGHTINLKTNRYKIPLSLEEINTFDTNEILALAKEPRMDFTFSPFVDTLDLSDFVMLPEGKHIKAKTEKVSDDPTKIVTCMQVCYNKGEITGTRHAEILRMASAFRRGGMPINACIASMTNFAETMEPKEVQRLVADVYKSGYRYSCNDEIMKRYCSDKCIFYKNKNYLPEIQNYDALEKEYGAFIGKDFSSTSFDLKDIYPDIPSYISYPGELIVVIGDTKLGKSAWIQNLCVDIPLPILYLSLEMQSRLTFRRFIQIAHDMKKEEVNQFYREGKKGLADKIQHIQIMTTAPKLESVEKLIIESGAKIVVVDVIDAIEVQGMDSESKLGPIGAGLKAIAQNMDIIIIAIHHISKFSSREGHLDIHSGKGSSSIEQKADKVIAIEGNRDTPYRKISSLGSRDESGFAINTIMNSDTFRFTPIPKNSVFYSKEDRKDENTIF